MMLLNSLFIQHTRIFFLRFLNLFYPNPPKTFNRFLHPLCEGFFCCVWTTHRIFKKIFAMSLQRIDHDLCSPMIDLPWLCSPSIIFITIANWTRCWRLLLCVIFLIAPISPARILYRYLSKGGRKSDQRGIRLQLKSPICQQFWVAVSGQQKKGDWGFSARDLFLTSSILTRPRCWWIPPFYIFSSPPFIIQIQIRKWRH